MKTILVPTDFSKNAENALNFAIELAKKENAKLILLHAYDIAFSPAYVPYEIIAEETANEKKETENKLKALCLKIKTVGGVKYESSIAHDFAADAILNTIKKKKADLVIMGTKGVTNFEGKLFGSNTAKVIEKANVPVIAIPTEIPVKAIKKVTYATIYNKSDISNLRMVVEIARLFNAQVNILHISETSNSPEEEKQMMEKFMKEITKKVNYNNLSFQILTGKNTEATLEKYIEANSTSMLVMSTHHRNFFDKFFETSVTKHLVNHLKIPLMAFHYNAKSAVKLY